MAYLFLDTSALMKLYLPESGAEWLRKQTATQTVIISELALYEGASVLRRYYLKNLITQAEMVNLYTRLRFESQNFNVILLRENGELDRVIALMFGLATDLRLRTLDAIQLAAAEQVYQQLNSLTPPEPFVFVSSDAQLLRVAQTRGLPTDNPENHLETDQNQP